MSHKTIQSVPPWLNAFMRFLLNSPLHWLVSDKIMLISFEGRKSGRKFTTPVSYLQTDDGVALFTHASWWRNLVGDVPVILRIKGKELPATAEAVIQDKATVAAGLTAHLLRNHFDAKYYHVTYDTDGNPKSDEVQRGAEGVVMVRLSTA